MKTATVLAVAVLAGRAGAEPRVDLTRCTAYDADALSRAIDRELPPETTHHEYVVVVDCPDLVTAHAHVEPIPTDGAIARDLDLGEVPGNMRLKFLALAVAELVVVASGAAPPQPPRQPPPPPREPPKRPHGKEPERQREAARDRDPDLRDEIHGTVNPPTPLRWSITPHVAVRVYPTTPRPLGEVGAELALGSMRIGIHGAIGQDSDPLGTLRPWLATISLARELVCGHSLCALIRLEGGGAGVLAQASAMASAHNATSLYGQAGLAGELVHKFSGWAAVASIDAGWAEGLIARAGGHDAAALAGLVVVGAVGARWQ